jgi:hypothetical protein
MLRGRDGHERNSVCTSRSRTHQNEYIIFRHEILPFLHAYSHKVPFNSIICIVYQPMSKKKLSLYLTLQQTTQNHTRQYSFQCPPLVKRHQSSIYMQPTIVDNPTGRTTRHSYSRETSRPKIFAFTQSVSTRTRLRAIHIIVSIRPK